MTSKEESTKQFIYSKPGKKCTSDLRMWRKGSRRFLIKRTKAKDFYLGDKVLKWDSRREDKGEHGKFDFLWKFPYVIYAFRGNNAFFLREMDGTEVEGGPMNG